MNICGIIDLFGEGSFDGPSTNPWETLLVSSLLPNNLRKGLCQSWSHLTSKFQVVATPELISDDKNILNQDLSSTGFYANGSRTIGDGSTDSNWPMQLWDTLAIQACITLNFVQSSRKDPNKSAYHSMNGERYGAIEAGWFFVLGENVVFQRFNNCEV